jgi:phage N-6-adenine-methyltransferase
MCLLKVTDLEIGRLANHQTSHCSRVERTAVAEAGRPRRTWHRPDSQRRNSERQPRGRTPASGGSVSVPPKRSATAALVGLDADEDRNDRPGPDVPVSEDRPSLDQLVADARAAEKRIDDLEQINIRTAKVLLFEHLDQAQRIFTAVECGQSVAAFARQAGIEERRAQRLYKLAERSDKIKDEVRAGEALLGDDYVCPSWKQFLRSEPAEHEDDETEPVIADALHQELAAAQTRIAELEVAYKLAETSREELDAKLKAQKKRALYGMFGRGDPEREAPQWLFDHFNREFNFTLDVAATAENAKCAHFFTKSENGLVQPWSGNVWLNPPFSEIEPWAEKGWDHARTGRGVVGALLPLWPSAPWFRKFVIHGHIRLLTTRFGAVGQKTPAPFDYMFVVWTASSQCKDGCLNVTLEDVPDPKKAAREARVVAKAVVQRKVTRR